jgi:predicted membrane channel-forming protein YqfA (hemolysin III family)
LPDEQKDDLDRELEELLQELRVALPGVQILFAFLLAVPFAQRFAEVNQLEKVVFFVALMSSLAAVGFFILPSAYHRIRFRDYDKERLVQTSSHAAIAGMIFLAVGLTASAFFVTAFLFETLLASLSASLVAGGLAWLWFGLPLLRKLRDERPQTRSR